jgi:hypothetical protein
MDPDWLADALTQILPPITMAITLNQFSIADQSENSFKVVLGLKRE